MRQFARTVAEAHSRLASTAAADDCGANDHPPAHDDRDGDGDGENRDAASPSASVERAADTGRCRRSFGAISACREIAVGSGSGTLLLHPDFPDDDDNASRGSRRTFARVQDRRPTVESAHGRTAHQELGVQVGVRMAPRRACTGRTSTTGRVTARPRGSTWSPTAAACVTRPPCSPVSVCRDPSRATRRSAGRPP